MKKNKKKPQRKNLLLEDFWIWVVLLVSLLFRVGLYRDHAPLWDASVYILMGKFIFSQGAIGLWEPYRPLLWPIMLGSCWKLGLDVVLWGRILQILFSLGSIYLVYLIGKITFNKRAGLLAAVFLSFSPTYFSWANFLYTGVPSTFLGLVSVYLLFRNKSFSSGIFLGLSFFTRFLQYFLFIPLLTTYLFSIRRKEYRLNALKFVSGFGLIFAVFVISNLIMYKSPFFPLITARKVLGAYAVLWYQGSFYYFKQLLFKENFSILFYPVGIFFVLKSPRDIRKITVFLAGFFLFFMINTSRMQALRYLIAALPYLYLLTACGILGLYDYFKKNQLLAKGFLAILFLGLIVFEYNQFKTISFPEKQLDGFQEYIEQNKDTIKGSVWISNPATLVYSDLKASVMMYYPVFDKEQAVFLRKNLDKADLILFNNADFPCAPSGEKECMVEKNRLIEDISSTFKAEAYARDRSGRILGGIFKRK